MPLRVLLAWAVLLSSCVDLTLPPELRPRTGGSSPDEDAATAEPEASPITPDGGSPMVDAPQALDPDADPAADAPEIDLPALPPDLAADKLPVDAPLLTNGSACTAGPQCQSGQCVDGFCCNLPCNGRCQACDVAGSEGKCTPIKAGDDPDNECDIEPVSSCGRDGACDGQGACRRYAAGVVCKPGSCASSMETGAST